MNTMQRITIVGFATAGMALFGAGAAMADTYHEHNVLGASHEGAFKKSVKAGTVYDDCHHKCHGKGKHHHHKLAFYKKSIEGASHEGAFLKDVKSVAK
ncbi:hypothetical protein [Spirillospora sp. NPDC029432]|uniref:hypothetical protein n=1 Tax=Spirillospora sp. NPDC029432 TaxID=3154599 RepID=UPI0034541AAA